MCRPGVDEQTGASDDVLLGCGRQGLCPRHIRGELTVLHQQRAADQRPRHV